MLPGASMKKASWILLTVLGVAITLISLVSASTPAASRAQRDEAQFRSRSSRARAISRVVADPARWICLGHIIRMSPA